MRDGLGAWNRYGRLRERSSPIDSGDAEGLVLEMGELASRACVLFSRCSDGRVRKEARVDSGGPGPMHGIPVDRPAMDRGLTDRHDAQDRREGGQEGNAGTV